MALHLSYVLFNRASLILIFFKNVFMIRYLLLFARQTSNARLNIKIDEHDVTYEIKQ